MVGLPLPAGEKLLKEAGHSTAAKNADTTFETIGRSNDGGAEAEESVAFGGF